MNLGVAVDAAVDSAPWRVAFALQDAGWYLRQDIIWHKPNPMPESVTPRLKRPGPPGTYPTPRRLWAGVAFEAGC